MEIKYLVWVIILQALMWLPYIVNLILRNGLLQAMGYEASFDKMDAWAKRMKKAHYNGVENLVLFAPLVLLLNHKGISTEVTTNLCLTYFVARIVHFVSFTFAIPYVRTLSFATGWVATLMLTCKVL